MTIEDLKKLHVGEEVGGHFPIGNVDTVYLGMRVMSNENGILQLEAGYFVGVHGGYNTRTKVTHEVHYERT